MTCPDFAIEYTDATSGDRVRESFTSQPVGRWIRRVERKRRGAWRTESTETVADVECARGTGEGQTNMGP